MPHLRERPVLEGLPGAPDELPGLAGLQGDSDPLDICVLTERQISHGDVLLSAIPIGGLAMLDGDEADDKILRESAAGHQAHRAGSGRSTEQLAT